MWDKRKFRGRNALLAAGLFALAFLLRLPALSKFLTADETYALSTAASFLSGLMQHDWAATVGLGYPAVTTSWLISAGLALKWVLARPPEFDTFAQMVSAFQARPLDMQFVLWARVGLSLFAAAGTVALWALVRKLLGDGIALLAAALLLLDPILLGYSRLASPDAPMIFLLPLTWISLLWAVQSKKRAWLVISGFILGLTLLTKIPALSLIPPIVLLLVQNRRQRHGGRSNGLWLAFKDVLTLGLSAMGLFGLLWPAMWSVPGAALQQVAVFTASMAGHSHELGNFWMGNVQTPGLLFYPAAILWRTTPVTLLGLALALLAMKKSPHRRTLVSMALLILWYALILSASPKKFDRYLFPVFPLIVILAAAGWLWLLKHRIHKKYWLAAVSALLVLSHGSFAYDTLPTYLTAYNPLLGGIGRARQTMLIGWGEELSDAATYLNTLPHARQNRVAAWYGYNVFAPFYHGPTKALFYDVRSAEDAYEQDIDFVVTYINQTQRQLLDASIAQKLEAPLFSSSKDGVALAQVYAWPKPFAHTTRQDVGPGLRLLGWEIAPFAPERGELAVTLYWDADTAAQTPSTPVHLWLKDAAGEVWAQTISTQPAASAPLTDAWLQHQARAQAITLNPPPGLLPGPYRLEMAAESGKMLSLQTITVLATPAEAVTNLQATPPSKQILFGDALALVGYEVSQPQKDTLMVTLLWQANQTPPAGLKSFVHVTDIKGNIYTQSDGPLAALPGQEPVEWHAGELMRQRWRIALPADAPAELCVYTGLYRVSDGQRLPLTEDGEPRPDSRYELSFGPDSH